MVGMKVRFIGEPFDYAIEPFIKGKVYEVLSVEKDWYRIICEVGEDYLFPPELFEIVEG